MCGRLATPAVVADRLHAGDVALDAVEVDHGAGVPYSRAILAARGVVIT